MKDFGILNHRIPKHSKYMTEESRILSFDKWPKTDIKDPLELARAGFYYTGSMASSSSTVSSCRCIETIDSSIFLGVEDKVRCYHCGGGLQKWKSNDDPWVEHAKWFSNCDFIFLVKGEDFVNEIKKKSWSGNEEVRCFEKQY